MTEYPFPHNGPVYVIYDRQFEIAYYARDGKKRRRIRNTEKQTWHKTREETIDNDAFWCVVKLVEMRV